MIEDLQKTQQAERALEEETSVLGSEAFFSHILTEDLNECETVEEADERANEIVATLESDMGEKGSELLKATAIEKLEGVETVSDYIAMRARILSSAFADRWSLEELELMQREDILSSEHALDITSLMYGSLSSDGTELTINAHHNKSNNPRE